MSVSRRVVFLATLPALVVLNLHVSAEPASTPRVALVAGGEHTCVIRTDGVAHCWGSHEFGTLLTNEGATLCGTPRRPAACIRRPVVLGDGGWSDLTLGSETICGLKQGGEVLCWGADHLGQVGHGDHSCALDYVFDPGPASCQLEPFKVHPR